MVGLSLVWASFGFDFSLSFVPCRLSPFGPKTQFRFTTATILVLFSFLVAFLYGLAGLRSSAQGLETQRSATSLSLPAANRIQSRPAEITQVFAVAVNMRFLPCTYAFVLFQLRG